MDYLLAILPVLLIGWVILHKGAKRGLILSRIFIVALLIAALAGPYNPMPVTETDETPSITVLSDETASMDVYEEGVGQEVFDYLEGITPTRMNRLSGLRSDIGDEIMASAAGGGHIVVVSDGNNNFGRDVGETIDFVSNTGTNVYAVTQIPEQNDLSVEIIGARTAVEGNENLVGIVVRQALSDARYTLTIMVDGEPKFSESITQKSSEKTLSFSNTFYTLGPHLITAQISSGDDIRYENNVFNKSIFVVPKPRVLLISPDTNSPLYQTLKSLYRLDIVSTLDEVNLTDNKVVVLDNLNEGWVGDVDELREYVAGGGGMVVVGGDNSYDFGDYLDSDLESLLPVESFSSTYAGSVNVVIVMDISGSLEAYEALDDEKAMVINMLMNMGRDTNVGVVAFGSKAIEVSEGMIPFSVHSNRNILIEKVKKLNAGYGTSMDEGIKTANEMLANTSGEKYMLIFSDGSVELSFEKTKQEIAALDTDDTKMIFVMINTNIVLDKPVRVNKNQGDYFLNVLSDMSGGEFYKLDLNQRLDIKFGREPSEIPTDGEEAYSVVRLDEEHFITRFLNITGRISGFNDVTQKVGSQRLVTTSMGKPIVTSWQFGLGRVVSFSTDNGKFWAGALYSGENARLMPSVVNWAVGDPRLDEGVVVHSSDIFVGTPGTITVYNDVTPIMTFGGADIPLIHTEGRTYEGIVNPRSQGVFELVVSAGGVTVDDLVAVNYPLEYRDIGNNPEFLEAVKRNNGGVYSVDQSKSLLFNDIKQNSIRTTIEKVSLKWLFLLAALLLFLGEVILRRARGIIDIKMKRKGEM
ncbi:MAG TPA: vWA domain-containing protein [Candidatus Nanoarchaeia archaeon]|nr:vWA domain-containing protein [Candidatus Nanoarchaeia archaeon]